MVWNKTRQSLMRLIIGGDWALALPKPVKRNLRWYWFDGLFSAAMVGLTSVATSIASMLVQRRVGALSDRWGPRRIQLMSMLLIPILPTCWIFITQPWQVIPVILLGGVLWGAYGLASFNYILALFPDAVRARYSALYQIVVTLALAGGAAVGSLVISKIGYQGIIILSALGRLIAGLVFARFVRPSRLEQLSVMDDAT